MAKKRSILNKLDIDKLKKIFATKQDLKKFATKQDIKDLRQELRQELTLYATKFDLQELKEELKEEIKNLPTKDEFFSWMDKISGELKNMRETYDLSAPKISDHEKRISKLENIHPQGQHAFP